MCGQSSHLSRHFEKYRAYQIDVRQQSRQWNDIPRDGVVRQQQYTSRQLSIGGLDRLPQGELSGLIV
jgi:hypothetical protein